MKPVRPALLSDQVAGGVGLVAASALALFVSRNLDTGTLAEIGPGLFPRALAVLLFGLGAVIVVLGLRRNGNDGVEPAVWSLRGPLFILGAVLLFGLSVRSLGLVLATPLAILVAGLADRHTRWPELAGFAVALTVFCALLFRFALKLPIPLAPWLVGY